MEMIHDIKNKVNTEASIRKCLSFVKEIEMFSINKGELVYVKVLGGIGNLDIEKLAIEGFKLRFANPITIETKYGRLVNGLSVSLEVLN